MLETAKLLVKKRQVLFLGVGIVNTLLDFAFYTLLTQTILQGTNKLALAGIISGTTALAVAFLTHSLITWRGAHINHRTFIKFFVFTGFGMWVMRPILLSAFINLTPLYHEVHRLTVTLHSPFSYDFIAKTGAFGFMCVVVLLYNYMTYNRFVFSKGNIDEE